MTILHPDRPDEVVTPNTTVELMYNRSQPRCLNLITYPSIGFLFKSQSFSPLEGSYHTPFPIPGYIGVDSNGDASTLKTD